MPLSVFQLRKHFDWLAHKVKVKDKVAARTKHDSLTAGYKNMQNEVRENFVAEKVRT